MSEEYEKFLNWCEDKWTQEHKMQKLLSKLSNDDIGFLKEQYEARLKADLKAILVELQLEIEEKAIRKQGIDSGFEYDYEFIQSEEVVEIIQNKINALEEKINDN